LLTCGAGIGIFTGIPTGLVAGTTYYCKAFATNGKGTAYGQEVTFTTLTVPTLTTIDITNIDQNSATGGGNILSDGGALIFIRGIVWSTEQNPTTTTNVGITTDGTGTGTYESGITGLSSYTTYFVRAYATNSVGTSYGDQKSFTTLTLPTVTTGNITSITQNSASGGGNVTSAGGGTVSARGIVWSTNQNPTVTSNMGQTTDGSGTGTFTTNITGLTANTTYYVRAYATNSAGTAYGEQKSFTTSQNLAAPTVSTSNVLNITANSATCGGTVSSDGNATVTARGVCWSTSQNPTISNYSTTNGSGTGIFTSTLSGLSANTTYYVRAYATNSQGTSYGSQRMFTTSQNITAPSVTTSNITSITQNSANSGGEVTSTGGGTVSSRGVVWSNSPNPTTASNLGMTTNGSGTGSFTSSLTSLSPNTSYYVRAYATNSAGTSYGAQLTFTTQQNITLPTVTTNNITSITQNSAIGGGDVTSAGGGTVTARGIVWSTSQNPTVTSNIGLTIDGSGTGTFTSSIVELSPNTTYYVRAYASNSAGTSYGAQLTFTTQQNITFPTVTTNNITSITQNSAIGGGNVTSAGGGTVTARGIVWSTSQNPTVTSNIGLTTDGSGTGTFTSSINGLSPGSTYYLRAYATNSGGTAYGVQIIFTTTMPDGPGSTITDADGNMYNTIWIGGRQWMKENLKTTKYRDGSSITNVTNNGVWVDLGTPAAYCWYNNNVANKPIYGALYNWYVINTGNLCPTDWHVPTGAEWTVLTDYVGGSDIAGTKLKATSGWNNNGNGTDNYNFSALPGGYRYHDDGTFNALGGAGVWWSSTDGGATGAWYWGMYSDLGSANPANYDKRLGLSVRCVRD
jgi:uncharacterized protein (TIGR02145 family)